MRSLTAVELGSDICALARIAVRGGEIRLTAAEILDPAAFPGTEAFTLALRQTRKLLRLPRQCRVVVWGLPDGASRRDANVKPLVEPLASAGFRVDRVVSPCNALAALARRMKTARGEGSTCWIAINRGGVAIVVVRPGKLLYSHSFAWDSSVGSSGSQARLLQRYSLVAFLAPEIKRAMAESRKYGTPVDAVVTCGNLPELRSLTMPLIEELDVEVETLDSLEGLVVKPLVAEKLAEWAPAIRIACAAAIARGTRPWDPSKKTTPWNSVGTYARAAALAAAVAGIGYLWYVRFAPKPGSLPPPVKVTAGVAKSPAVAPPPVNLPQVTPPAVSAPATTAKSAAPALSEPAKIPESKGAVSVPAKKPESNPPAPIPWKPAVVTPPAAVNVAAKKPESTPPAARVPAAPAKVSAPAVSGQSTYVPPKGGSDTVGRGAGAPALSESARAVSVPAKKPESNPPAVSVPAKKPESNPPAKPASVNAANTIPRPRMQPLVTVPSPNTPAPRAPVSPSTLASAPAPGVIAREPAPRPNPPVVSAPPAAPRSNPPAVSPSTSATAPARSDSAPAVSVAAKSPESNPAAPRAIPPAVSAPPPAVRSNPAALNPPVPAADKSVAGGVVRSAWPVASTASTVSGVRTVSAVQRGPMPARLKDAVPRVTAILVGADRRFATVDGGQIIGIGDLVGRRTVVGMDERSVVLQEPSGVQLRIGLGGRILGVERARR